MCVDSVHLLFVILHLIPRKVNFCYGTKGWVILVFSTCNIYFFHYVQIKLHGIFSMKCVNLPNIIVQFTLIHSDLWGPSCTPNRTYKKWFITFIDDHTHLCWVYLLTDKIEVPSVFMNFHFMIQTQFHTKIQILCTDNGTEYFNHSLSTYLQENGIIHQSSCVDTPQQNGVAEWKNRHILKVARTLLFTSRMPSQFWGDSILTATYLIN